MLPFPPQNPAHGDFRPGGSLGDGLVCYCPPLPLPWAPERRGPSRHLCQAGPLECASRSPLAFLSLLPRHLHHIFCLATCPPLTPVSCPHVVVIPPLLPPPLGFFWRGSASGRSAQRPSRGPEPRLGSAWDGGAEARAGRPAQVSVRAQPQAPGAAGAAAAAGGGARRSWWAVWAAGCRQRVSATPRAAPQCRPRGDVGVTSRGGPPAALRRTEEWRAPQGARVGW